MEDDNEISIDIDHAIQLACEKLKGEILTEIRNEFKIKDLQGDVWQLYDGQRSNQTQLFEMSYQMQEQKIVLEDVQNKINSNLKSSALNIEQLQKKVNEMQSSIGQTFSSIKLEIQTKTDENDFLNLRSRLIEYTPIDMFQQLKQALDQYALSTELQQTKEKIHELENLSKSFVQTSLFNQELEESKNQFQKSLESYVTLNESNKNMKTVYVHVDDINGKTEKMIERAMRGVNKLKGVMNQLRSFIYSKPWDDDLGIVNNKLTYKASIDDLQKFRQDIILKQQDDQKLLQKLIAKLKKNAQALERFDEIILQKASKFEISKLQDQIKSLHNELNKHNYNQDELSSAIKLQSQNFETSQYQFSKLNTQLENLRGKVALLPARSTDFNSMFAELKEIANSKADKSDIILLVENLSKRDDVQKLKLQLESIYKHFHSAIILQLAITQTMIKPNQTPQTKIKQRLEIYHQFQFLER